MSKIYHSIYASIQKIEGYYGKLLKLNQILVKFA